MGELFKGYIDEVRVFNRALTPSEVTELYTYTEGTPDTQAPSVPTGLTASATSVSQINLSWTASTDNTAVTGYKIYRCTGSSCTPTTLVSSPSATTYSNTGLLASTAYTYAVSAVDAAANESAKSITASATTLSPDTQAPSVPSGLSAMAVSSSQINLSWTASVDNNEVTGYKVYRCQGASCTPTTLVSSPSGVTYSDTGLLASTAYTYAVSAVDAAANESAKSSSASATTQAEALVSGAWPVAYYNLNETSGTSAADSSGNANTATLNGGAAWVAGKVGTGAVSLDGTNDYIDAPHSAGNSISGNAVSISAWVYRTNTDTAPRIIAAKVVPGHSPPFFSYSIHLLGGDTPSFWVSTGGDGEHLQSPVPITANAWHHIIGVYDGATKKIYVDGVEKNNANRIGNLNTYTSPLRIGANGALGELFKGYIDDVRVYNRALTPSEVTELYKSVGIYVPLNVQATAFGCGSKAIAVTWDRVNDPGNVLGYKVERSDGYVISVYGQDTVVYNDSNTDVGSTYSYVVRSTFFDSGTSIDSASSNRSVAVTVPSSCGVPVSCPIRPKTGRVIINFDGNALDSQTEQQSTGSLIAATGPQGEFVTAYRIILAGYDNHPETTPEYKEKYRVALYRDTGGADLIWYTNDLPDLPDDDEYYSSISDTISAAEAATVRSVKPAHPAYSTSESNDITPVCMAFDPIETSGAETEGCSLYLDVTADRSSVAAGDVIKYTIDVTNVGNRSCTGEGVWLQQVLDPREAIDEMTMKYPNGGVTKGHNATNNYNVKSYDVDSHTANWNVANLVPGETQRVTYDSWIGNDCSTLGGGNLRRLVRAISSEFGYHANSSADSVSYLNWNSHNDEDVTCTGGVIQPPTVSCEVVPSIVNTGVNTIWNAIPSGGSGTYTYSWSGDMTGASQSMAQVFSTVGIKTASVQVTSAGQTSYDPCTAAVAVIANYDPPACPFVESDDRTVVIFDNQRITSYDTGDSPTETLPVFTSLPVGNYAVTLYSYDGSSIRAGYQQLYEQWQAVLKDENGGELAQSAPIDDLEDGEAATPGMILDKSQSYSLHNFYGAKPAFYLVVGGLPGSAHVVSGEALTANAWHHLLGVYDGSDVKLYVDGSLAGSAAATGNITTSNHPLRVGTNLGLSEKFRGLVDDARVYNTALNAAQIAELFAYGGGSPSPSVAPSAYYAFEEGVGASVEDSSSADNTAILNGNVLWSIGKIGNKSIYLDGGDDYVDAPDAPGNDISGNQITVSAWVYPIDNAVVDLAQTVNDVNTPIYISSPATAVIARHAHLSPDDTANSVYPVCAAFDKVNPTLSISNVSCSASASVVNVGQQVTWSSTITPLGEYDITWTDNLGAIGTGGTVSRTYSTVGRKTATVDVADYGDTVDCTATVRVIADPSYTEF